MTSLLYLKHRFDLSDEELVPGWSENIVWQLFSDREYYEARPPCDASQVVRFRRAIGEDGLEQLLKTTIECAVESKAVKPSAEACDPTACSASLARDRGAAFQCATDK